MEKKELKGTKTERNLMEAFAGESQARNKYTYFASKAKKEGYEQIAALFEETAQNEKEHAKMWFKLLEGGAIKDTMSNLKAAAEGEGAVPKEAHPEAPPHRRCGFRLRFPQARQGACGPLPARGERGNPRIPQGTKPSNTIWSACRAARSRSAGVRTVQVMTGSRPRSRAR